MCCGVGVVGPECLHVVHVSLLCYCFAIALLCYCFVIALLLFMVKTFGEFQPAKVTKPWRASRMALQKRFHKMLCSSAESELVVL